MCKRTLVRCSALLLAIAVVTLPLLAPGAAQAQVKCFVGIPPLAWFVERLGGSQDQSQSLVQAQVLASPGASPHTYEPTPRQVAALGQAQIYFTLKLPFEEKFLPRALAANPGLKAVDVTQGMTLRRLSEEEEAADEAGHGHDKGHDKGHGKGEDHGHDGQADPHVWLSPAQARIMAANLAQGLMTADPAHASQYQANLERLLEEITALDQRLAAVLAPLKGREFFVYHPAFGYLGEAYGLKQTPVEIEGKEPGPKRLARLIDAARARGTRVIFVQPQFPAGTARRLAEAIGGAVVPLDPLARDWAANLERLARAIEAGLKP
jgi:zinc transport system substrate-binding protein